MPFTSSFFKTLVKFLPYGRQVGVYLITGQAAYGLGAYTPGSYIVNILPKN